MVAYSSGLAVDFGTLGLWHFDGADWTQLNEDDPQWLAVYGNYLVVDYGSLGLWQFDGVTWTQIRSDNPDNTGNTMLAYNSGLAVDFGTLGLWHFDGTDWTQLNEDDPQWLFLWGDRLVEDHGGLYLREDGPDGAAGDG